MKQRKGRNDSKGLWETIALEPIQVPQIMTESKMHPYRELGWSMLIDAVLDLSTPVAPKGRHTTETAAAELATNNAKRWISGESDPEMLSLACSLAGVSERWIKEKVATIKQFPSRTEMKRMLSEWRASVGQRKQPTVESRLQCYMDFNANNDLREIAESIPHTEPVYTFTGSVDVKKSRQHNRQVAIGP